MLGAKSSFLSLFWVYVLMSFVFIGVNAQDVDISRERGSRFVVNVGDEVPHFSYTTIDGDEGDSDFMKGQVVLIHFAASWCPISATQRRDVQEELIDSFGDNDFSVLCVSVDEPKDTALFVKMLKEESISYSVVLDYEERLYREFVTPKGSVTRSVVIGRDGRIAYLTDEYNRKKAKEIKKVIVRELKKQ